MLKYGFLSIGVNIIPLVHRKYLPNKVGTHLDLSRLMQIGVNGIPYASRLNHARCGYRTHNPRVMSPTSRPCYDIFVVTKRCALFKTAHMSFNIITHEL